MELELSSQKNCRARLNASHLWNIKTEQNNLRAGQKQHCAWRTICKDNKKTDIRTPGLTTTRLKIISINEHL